MKNLSHYKELLLDEKAHLEEELRSVGHTKPENVNDWEGTPGDIGLDVEEADRNSVADKIEEYEERSSVALELEENLNEIKKALKRVEDETYGLCKICGKEIEDTRLLAILSAETCKTHINE